MSRRVSRGVKEVGGLQVPVALVVVGAERIDDDLGRDRGGAAAATVKAPLNVSMRRSRRPSLPHIAVVLDGPPARSLHRLVPLGPPGGVSAVVEGQRHCARDAQSTGGDPTTWSPWRRSHDRAAGGGWISAAGRCARVDAEVRAFPRTPPSSSASLARSRPDT